MDEHDDNTMPNHLFISLRYEFKATRIIDQRLSPTTIKIKADVSTLEHVDDQGLPVEEDSDDYGTRMEVALAKMSYWVERVLNNSILLHSDNEWALDRFSEGDSPSCTNALILCPEEPTDACLAELLLCKFKALTKGAFSFHAIDIESTDGRGMGFTFVGLRPGESFASDVEWLTESNFFSRPWWHRDDASSMDVVPDEGDDLNKPPAWAYSLGFIADQMANPQAPSNVIVRPEFRPRVIDGGKVD